MERNNSTSTSERIGTSSPVHFRWFTWHDAIHRIYPKAKQQVCCVHISRNIASKVRVKDRPAILDDFKNVYQAKDRDVAVNTLNTFKGKTKKVYSRVIDTVISNDQLLTFYDFPASIRRSIYSTNLIEAFNKEIKRYVKRKEQFPNEDALERFPSYSIFRL